MLLQAICTDKESQKRWYYLIMTDRLTPGKHRKENMKNIGRVWIDTQSTHNPYHEYNGRVGIMTPDIDADYANVFFTEGPIISFRIPKLYLAPWHGKCHHKYCFCTGN